MCAIETIGDPNMALNMFYGILHSFLDVHAPMKEKRIKREQQPGWFTEEIQSLIYKRDNCHKNGNFNEYKTLRNKINASRSKTYYREIKR